jgi:hypothetical protein
VQHNAESGVAQTKPRARLISLAWGKRYIDNFLCYTLPAALAPGNIPKLCAHFDLEFVFATEHAHFARVQHARSFQELDKHCSTRLIAIDNLVVRGSYGITLTYAYHAGFADLGDAMRDYYLFFLNADFILADGSYATAVERIKNGARLLLSPSYCVAAEQVVPHLDDQVSEKRPVLAIPKRDMAALALRHRHNSIRGKTVNQSRLHMDFIEQFYWQVDDHTLLARQLPIAIVGLRPERTYAEPVTFWDYGLLSEICPTTEPCVLGDSDEFLMIELREEASAKRNLRVGWPTQEEIARRLSTFTTADQRKHGLFPLVLHSRDLPADLASGHERLSEYVDGVYRLLGPPKDHRNHSFWQYHLPRLRQHQFADSVTQQLLGPQTPGVDDVDKGTVQSPAEEVQVRKEVTIEEGHSWLARIQQRLIGLPPRVSKSHPLWVEYRHISAVLGGLAKLTPPQASIIVLSDFRSGKAFADLIPGLQVLVPSDIPRHLALRPINRPTGPSARRQPEPAAEDSFDFCLMWLKGRDIEEFPLLHRNVRSSLRANARMVLFFSNMPSRCLEECEVAQAIASFDEADRITVSYAPLLTSLMARGARALFRWGRASMTRSRYLGVLGAAALAPPALLFAWMVNRRLEGRDFATIPAKCANVTIIVETSGGSSGGPCRATSAASAVVD